MIVGGSIQWLGMILPVAREMYFHTGYSNRKVVDIQLPDGRVSCYHPECLMDPEEGQLLMATRGVQYE